jgi:hypothetical protein
MKLNLIFALIDTLILVAYPIVYLISKVRQFMGFKR